MLEGKAVIGESDMLQTMQQDALDLAAKALDFYDVTEPTEIARFIKKEFDRLYGPGWQCIVGTDFSSFVTHCTDVSFTSALETLLFCSFRGSAGPEAEATQNSILEAVKA
ncbi:uncharacterized protein LOC131323295 isoform X2 [Rhododendron vialii]|uniref:uncharacterized protein LOC131323295 isoform X2 n=1 Tax=Rhododendron vialii TaxID=182163 RepID=UPI00265FA4F4|nr:uncharacterized protein LOC131323295 isoform X2 [Rhododendron vialii]